MARPLRVEYAGAFYHVTSRGNRRDNIYYEDDDRLLWLDLFSKVCSRFNWRCHAWCLMDNHYHIVIETVEGNLSQGMRQLNGVYTQRSNLKHKRVGHVFQGRYKAILVQKDDYLLELARYVVLNPVRAKMVNDVIDWVWSSYHVMIGQSKSPEWLETDSLLARFSENRQIAVNKYIDFVRAGVGLPSIWGNIKHQMYLGSEDFVEKIQNQFVNLKNQDLGEVTRIQRRSLAKPLEWYERNTSTQKKAMALAYASGGYTMKEISGWFGVHYSTVSRAVKKQESDTSL